MKNSGRRFVNTYNLRGLNESILLLYVTYFINVIFELLFVTAWWLENQMKLQGPLLQFLLDLLLASW